MDSRCSTAVRLNQEEWGKVWDLFEAAAELPAHEQRAWLDQNASAELRAHVAALLGKVEEDGGEPDHVAPQETPRRPAVIGRFEIIELLGRGGMGEVYRAFDPELDRHVAIKCIAPGRVGTAGMVTAMIQEARAASALNHPGIVTIYEVIRTDESVAIVMELVEGESLRALTAAAQPLERVTSIGERVAEALSAAHRGGIIHRDIKPENVLVRADGYVKILDFGLAVNPLTAPESQPAGTFRYMPPEQALGHTLTSAADVFSLGVVLYELATGVHPFGLASGRSDSTLAVLEAISTVTPPRASAAATGLPRAMDTLLARMLSRTPAARPSAEEVARELERIRRRAGTATRRRIATPVAVIVLALAGAGVWRAADKPAAPPALRVSTFTTFAGSETEPAFSPDGTAVAFVWSGPEGLNKDIYIKRLGQDDVQRLTDNSAEELTPAFSPDGRSIAFLRRSPDTGNSRIVVMPSQGGPEEVVAEIAFTAGFRGLTWWPDGESFLVRDRLGPEAGLVRVYRDGRKEEFVEGPRGGTDSLPQFSAGGGRVAFLRAAGNSNNLCVVERDASGMRCFDAKDASGLAWLPGDDALLFGSREGLYRVQVSGRHAGHSAKVADGVFQHLAGDPGGRTFGFSRILSDVNIWQIRRDGAGARRFIASSGEDSEPAWSPDGSRVLVRSNRSGNYELYSYAADGTGEKRLTDFRSDLGSARWSPDGTLIVFDGRGGPLYPSQRHNNLFVVSSEGGPVRRLTDDRQHYYVPAWSRDGRSIYCLAGNPARQIRVSVEDGHMEEFDPDTLFDLSAAADQRDLYYVNGKRGKGIIRRTAGGGPDLPIPGTEALLYRYWGPAPNGVYFVDGPPHATLRFWDSRTNKVRRIAALNAQLVQGPRAMAVSPDGSAVLYTAEDLTASDIMLLTPQ